VVVNALRDVEEAQEVVRQRERDLAEAREALGRAVATAHDKHGVSWTLIGRVLGVSRQRAVQLARGRD
jgi:hypothetical protein